MIEIGEDGLTHQMAPLVQYALNFCIATRSQELNPTKVRANGTSSSTDTHFWAPDDTKDSKGNQVVATFISLLTSKLSNDQGFVPIVEKEDLPKIKRFIEFLQDPRTCDRACYSRIDYYKAKKPCGPYKNSEWSRIWPVVFKDYNLAQFIQSWGYLADPPSEDPKTKPRLHLNPSDGRSFGANCINENIFKTEGKQHNTQIVSALLGHSSNTTKLTYLKITTNPTTIPGLRIMVNTDGINYTKDGEAHCVQGGVYLIEDHEDQDEIQEETPQQQQTWEQANSM